MLPFIQSRVLTEHPLGTRNRVADKANSLLHGRRRVSTVERAIDPGPHLCRLSWASGCPAFIRQCQRRVDFPSCCQFLPSPDALTQSPRGFQYCPLGCNSRPLAFFGERVPPRPGFFSPLLVIPDFHRSLEKCHLDQITFKLFTDSRLK